jgi:DNA adenine methylase
MLLYVLENFSPKTIHINDSYEGITNVYKQIKENFSEFSRVLNLLEAKYMPLSKEDRKKFYYETREKHAYFQHLLSKPEEAAYHFFLQKTSFNGILQFNKNTNNRFGTPAGLLNHKNEIYSRENLKYWNNLLQSVEIQNSDYSKCNVSGYDVVYVDPPYRSSFADYGSNWGDKETEELLDWIFSLKGSHVLFCNRCSGDGYFDSRKRYLDMEKFPIVYTAGRRLKSEDGIFSAKEAIEILLYGEIK